MSWILNCFDFRVENIILGFGLKCYIGEKNELKKQFCLEGEICVTHVNSKYTKHNTYICIYYKGAWYCRYSRMFSGTSDGSSKKSLSPLRE